MFFFLGMALYFGFWDARTWHLPQPHLRVFASNWLIRQQKGQSRKPRHVLGYGGCGARESEPRRDPPELEANKVRPASELRSDPAELRPDPSELRSDPSELRFNPSELRSDPSELRSDPSELRSNPSELRSDPSELRSELQPN